MVLSIVIVVVLLAAGAGFGLANLLNSRELGLREAAIEAQSQRINDLEGALAEARAAAPGNAFQWTDNQRARFLSVVAARNDGPPSAYQLVFSGRCRECRQIAEEMQEQLAMAGGRWSDSAAFAPTSTTVGAPVEGLVLVVPPVGSVTDSVNAIIEVLTYAKVEFEIEERLDIN